VGNTKELQGGIIVNSKREMSLAIKQLTMDANYYSQLSAAGYSAILNTYNLNNIVTIYEKLYQSLIDLS
jgi:glycosyltransferase involved in cell wall biosynthesis